MAFGRAWRLREQESEQEFRGGKNIRMRHLTINHYIHYVHVRTDPSEGHYVACHDAYANHQDRRTFETRKRLRLVKALEAMVLSARDQLMCYLEPGLGRLGDPQFPPITRGKPP